MPITLFGLSAPLLSDRALEMDRLMGSLMPRHSTPVTDFVCNAVPEEYEKVQNRNDRKQSPGKVQRENILDHGKREQSRVQPRQPLHFNRNDQEEQKLHIRVEHGEREKQREIDVTCPRHGYVVSGDQ